VSAAPAGGPRDGQRMSGPDGPRAYRPGEGQRPHGVAAAITDVSERATMLVREEIELAKAEIAEKTAKLARGAAVAVAAGVFLLTALFFILIGCAWLLYYELPIGNEFTYFWGFFVMAAILIVLAVLAGLAAARAVRSSAPPVPEMAIDQARKIRETVAAGSEPPAGGDVAIPPSPQTPSSSGGTHAATLGS
jgi:hypothetical protein